MKRSIKATSLLFASVSAVLGSGWMFGAFYSAILAGPAALLSWVIGGILILFIAFVFAELSACLPITGSSIRIPHFTHGTVTSFSFSWIIWLCYMVLAPTEVQAMVQYLSFYFPAMTHENGALTHIGYGVAILLMALVSALNTYSLRWLMRLNTLITLVKIIVPVILTVIILALFFKPAHLWHPVGSAFMPMGVSGVLSALSMGGIVFAFNGFKQAAEMAGEALNPKRALPIALIGSIGVCLVIYLLLQMALLTSLQSENLLGGWGTLHFNSALSPFADVLLQDHLHALLPLLFLGAILGPCAAGMMYCASAGRSLFGMSKNGYVPLVFQRLTRQGNPGYAILLNFLLGILMFAPLPGWNEMAAFLTSLMAVTYTIGPVTLLALRKQLPDRPRPFRLPCATLWCYIALTVSACLTYWSGWYVLSKLAVAILIGLLVLLISQACTKRHKRVRLYWRESIWLWVYFVGMTLLSYLGTFGGGRGLIGLWESTVLIAVLCIIVLWLSYVFRRTYYFETVHSL